MNELQAILFGLVVAGFFVGPLVFVVLRVNRRKKRAGAK